MIPELRASLDAMRAALEEYSVAHEALARASRESWRSGMPVAVVERHELAAKRALVAAEALKTEVRKQVSRRLPR